MQSVGYIVTAKHYATRDGARTVRERIQRLAIGIRQRNGLINLHVNDDPKGFAVLAEIDFGQWIGHCECGGAEFVDHEEPIFMCFSCGNRNNAGYLRPVIFPAERETIEALVLERPVNDLRGLDDLDRAYQAKPLLFAQMENSDGTSQALPLSRSWTPNESVDELRRQNKAVYAWRASLGDVR